MHQIAEFINEASFTVIGLAIALLGLVLLVLPVVSRFKYKLINFSTRKVGGEKTLRRYLGFAFATLVVGIFILIVGKWASTADQYLDPDHYDWVGIWNVALEENGSIRYGTRRGWELKFDVGKEGLIATLYNEDGHVEGYLRNLSIQENAPYYLRGKLGYNDGRKMKFQFLMFPDEQSFMGRYKSRHGSDGWETWIGHRK